MQFHENFYALRENSELTQKQLARELDLSISSICNYENGNRFPDLPTLLKISDFFNVSLDYLLGRSAINDYELLLKRRFTDDYSLLDYIDTILELQPISRRILLNITMLIKDADRVMRETYFS